ncbi:phosphoribosyl anthranilate isomerase [Suillus clintonianus]|uniref:phosphoribosyl anthranilate isomerase n=1 Tax=Suillus clintonianus TaxID=1904413 RepID=UPI001B85F113|nr:phosphoribosyl anthranilate isomerase [Suillus clintonianus]KAG2153174.1 phosphoribosyl anthranilate isomerase [Suillus clintonianus]
MTPTPLPATLSGDIDTLMIDNFDSFTWNLYQSLSLLGTHVTVIRNNALTADQLPLLRINRLIISPGPGHPKTDSGVSRDAIKYFAGKVPVLGVCMGLECIVDVYGGEIGYAGEIKHGKLSPITHDARSIFLSLPQFIQSTRYHSLSASLLSLPPCLMVTSATSESGVIMGVRHRTYVVEAVQYHPESILSEEGEGLLRNFLSLKGGTWEENPHAKVNDPEMPPFPYEALTDKSKSITTEAAKSSAPSILTKIAQKRTSDVEILSNTPGLTLPALNAHLSLHLAPPPISLSKRLLQARNGMALLAEIKRASPSAGSIAPHTSAPHMALSYALAGASAISVLTEPTYFHGHLEDMRAVRSAIDGLDCRPAVLRKDFVLSEYQVVEARLAGADSVLLIVAMLGKDRTRALLEYSMTLGMEPLVEVNSPSELHIALDVGAKIIGVNNRNLHSFVVDMSTTSGVAEVLEQKGKTGEVILCALSGIKSPADVRAYREQGVKAVLVGESLMRAEDTGKFIRNLLDWDEPIPKSPSSPEIPKSTPPTALVKICGILTPSEALSTANAGADFLGLVFVPNSKRRVTVHIAREISLAVRNAFPLPDDDDDEGEAEDENSNLPLPWFTSHTHASYIPSHARKVRPLLVGVFQNQPLRFIQRVVRDVGLDIVQLHGSEPIEWARSIGVPVIRVGGVPPPPAPESAPEENPESTSEGNEAEETHTAPLPSPDPLAMLTTPGYHHFILLDTTSSAQSSSPSGGTGNILDWSLAAGLVRKGEVPVISPDVSISASLSSAVNSAGEQNDDDERTSTFPLPLILAGGLNPLNVREAVERVQPWVVDVSGGVERDGVDSELEKVGGRKDEEKVRAFVKAAKGME